MKRNYGLDLLRVFLCLCVITTHSIQMYPISNSVVASVFFTFIFQADDMFFLLSGYFNLDKEFKNKSDIIKFYKRKFITAFIPFLLAVFIHTGWDYIKNLENASIFDFLRRYYEAIVDTSASGHMWFLYTLFGLLLSTPFLSKMLHNMDDKELTLLWYICLGWNFVSIYLCNNLGFAFRFGSWIFDDWALYYFGGYYYRRVVKKQSMKKWAVLGILGFVLTNIGKLYMKPFYAPTTSQILYTLFVMSCLMFWDKIIKIKNEKAQKVILFLSKNTYSIYLYHMLTIGFVYGRFAGTDNNFLVGFPWVFVAFAVALVLSVITNFCLKPIQKFIDKVWIVKESC